MDSVQTQTLSINGDGGDEAYIAFAMDNYVFQLS